MAFLHFYSFFCAKFLKRNNNSRRQQKLENLPSIQRVNKAELNLLQVSDGKISIDFLLPNGMFIPKTVDFDMPLDMLKQVRPEVKIIYEP